MREPANQSLITDVSRLCPHRCTIIASNTSRENRGEAGMLHLRSLTRDIRATCGVGREARVGFEGANPFRLLYGGCYAGPDFVSAQKESPSLGSCYHCWGRCDPCCGAVRPIAGIPS
jgi:hypothetical protein